MGAILLAFVLLSIGSAVSLIVRRRATLASGVGVATAVAGMGLVAYVAIVALMGRAIPTFVVPTHFPVGAVVLGVDAVSGFFMVPLAALGILTAVYGRGYWLESKGGNAAVPMAVFNLLLASMLAVVVARDWFFLVLAWEAMTLASFFLVTLDHGDAETRRAGWIYLVAAHVGEGALLGLLVIINGRVGGTAFAPIPGTGGGLFALALIGFGIKAGFVPFHVWLPKAHAAAPSPVSALMSGVLVKMGVYGLLRTLTLLPYSSVVGPVLFVVGMMGAVWGIGMALSQRDLKRVLAYSTVENMGIVALGLGLAYWRWGRGNHSLAALAAVGALLHVWNHAMMKGLMFLAAGSVVHATGTRDLEKMGGLLRRMPFVGVVMVVGAVAMAGLPPLNGFVGEWLIYFGFLGGGLSGGGASGVAILLSTGIFAVVGGLAALCFVRLVGIALLGEPRAPEALRGHDPSRGMAYPLAMLAAIVVALGLFPGAALPAMSRVVDSLFGGDSATYARMAGHSLWVIGIVNAVLWVALVLLGAWLFRRVRTSPQTVETWSCGYAAPSPRMQYTARSFSEFVVGKILPKAMRPPTARIRHAGVFPVGESWVGDGGDPLLRRVFKPLFRTAGDHFLKLRWLQPGATHFYLLYIFLLAVLALGWVALRRYWAA